MCARQFDFLAALGLCALCSATVWADDVPPTPAHRYAAIATDDSTTPTPAEVAREVVKLQEELGGSITRQFGEIPPWAPGQPYPPAQPPHRWPPTPKSRVAVLREVSWQLEQSAHLLETLDLYDQADAVRQTAAKLREDAREIRAGSPDGGENG